MLPKVAIGESEEAIERLSTRARISEARVLQCGAGRGFCS